MTLRTPKGVFDIVPEAAQTWRSSTLWLFVEEKIRATAQTYGYREIRTPIFEQTELFARGVGEHSDIVSKEMYSFEDRSGRSMTLRPEGTAPVMRSFLCEGMAQSGSIHKLFYIAPMFRYERQQAGRYRQHHQFGVEAIGQGEAEQDVEVVDLLYTLCQRLGLRDLHLEINSLGDEECRKEYRERLINYLTPFSGQLSEDSRRRLEANPLRVLDSKATEDREIVANAPSILDALEEESRAHFERFKALLTRLKIPYTVNPRLVRGLDYYNRTVFELQCRELGALTSLGGGGRYDPLLPQLGGPPLPAIGFGSGMERLIQAMIAQGAPLPEPMRPDYYLAPLGEEGENYAVELLAALRHSGISAEMGYRQKKMAAHLRHANHLRARRLIALGSEELERGQLTVQDLDRRTAAEIPISPSIEIMATQLKERIG